MRYFFEGRIFGAAFESGDRFVVGSWTTSPFGPISNVMWAQPDGARVLVAPDGDVARFISTHYSFDEVRVAPVEIDATRVQTADLTLELRPSGTGVLGLLVSVNPLRRLHRVNDLFASRVLPGVRTQGTTRAGARQRYVISRLRRMNGWASVGGRDLGAAVDARAPAGFGFSESPPFPFCVWLRTTITTRPDA